MAYALRIAIGVTVALSGLLVGTGPAMAAAAPDVCRYYRSDDKVVPVKSGPGKQYKTQGYIKSTREAPLFGTCATPGTGPTHWVKVVKGKFKDSYVWRNRLDRF